MADAKTAGRFITLEGVDGAGKSTHIPWIAERLRAGGREVVLTREPGGTPLAEKLRAVVLAEPMDPLAETLLMFAARADHVRKVIAPALARGAWVVCDRFTDATLAYQGGGRAIPMPTVTSFNRFATGGLKPDLTLFFDLSPEEGFRRLGRRAHRRLDRLEVERAAFYRRVRRSYVALAEREPGRVKRLSASGSPDEVQERVLETVERFLHRRGFLKTGALHSS